MARMILFVLRSEPVIRHDRDGTALDAGPLSQQLDRIGVVESSEVLGDLLANANATAQAVLLVPDEHSESHTRGGVGSCCVGSTKPSALAAEFSQCPPLSRWAKAVVAVQSHRNDFPTLRAWGRAIGASEHTIRTWCQAARLSPKKSLQFARLLRAVARADAYCMEPWLWLDVVDPRTLSRLLSDGGLSSAPKTTYLEQFLASQKLIAHEHAILSVRLRLPGPPSK
jgi:hypothetical protein